ncbi:rhamnan synthesis F family protein [uncultured Succinatimonas sp.]|uniref:rhamnan synthesis F family protein n=1 Tax=uncultured Succinatimonas sp. TaxID=1262973 RepID=UPI0025F271C9|nr:rhamnan synthesis F family protein [uncultured Succinatimonas sp.]
MKFNALCKKIKNNIKLYLIKYRFDSVYYLNNNPDVKKSGIAPWTHFVKYGYKEGRKPYAKKSNYKKYNILSSFFTFCLKYKKIKYPDTRIAVILHLYYIESWLEIKSFLDSLLRYKNVDFYFSCIEGIANKEIINTLKNYNISSNVFLYPNKGYDIGSFIDILHHINLDDYDIVYKLHSKGVSRRRIFIYNQIFKKRDWFLNLYKGLFGYRRTDEVINVLSEDNKYGIVAADNLIIHDPKHKVSFTRAASNKLGIKINNDYNYVAGTCFAIRSFLLKPISNLNLTINDFKSPKPGEFSLAHALERIVCACIEPQGYKFYGTYVKRKTYTNELQKAINYSALRLLDDTRFKLDYDFFYKVLELRKIYHYEICSIKLKDIKRRWKDGKIYSLEDCSPFQYLKGNINKYEQYCIENKKDGLFLSMSRERYDKLIKSMELGYDTHSMPVISKDNIILDGQHRCCILLYKYGPDYSVDVLKVFY